MPQDLLSSRSETNLAGAGGTGRCVARELQCTCTCSDDGCDTKTLHTWGVNQCEGSIISRCSDYRGLSAPRKQRDKARENMSMTHN